MSLTILDFVLLGITLYIAILLADLTASAIKWQVANYRLRKELYKRKQKVKDFSIRFKQKLGLAKTINSAAVEDKPKR